MFRFEVSVNNFNESFLIKCQSWLIVNISQFCVNALLKRSPQMHFIAGRILQVYSSNCTCKYVGLGTVGDVAARHAHRLGSNPTVLYKTLTLSS